jgi:hypothetical protein
MGKIKDWHLFSFSTGRNGQCRALTDVITPASLSMQSSQVHGAKRKEKKGIQKLKGMKTQSYKRI